MYAVIFKAEINKLDDEYGMMAEHMRELAFQQGCIDFIAVTEGNKEIAISYWQTKEQIQAWKNHPAHQKAQSLGRAKWYSSYQVQVVEVLHQYWS